MMWWKDLRLRQIVHSQYYRFKFLGSGLNGAVFRARHRGTDEFVAIKLVHIAAADRTTKKRFDTEVEAMKRLQGKLAVRVFDSDIDADPPYYVMEYLELGDLRSRLHKRISTLSLLSLFLNVCKCVAGCHKNKITHRDIKPENILFRSPLRPVLADFGICKLGADSLGTTVFEMQKRGTPLYMAPEQLRDYLEQSKPADIYALGVMLHFDIAEKLKPRSLRERTEVLAQACTVNRPEKRPDIGKLTEGVVRLLDEARQYRSQRPPVSRLIQMVEVCRRRAATQDLRLIDTEARYLEQRMEEFNFHWARADGSYETSEKWFWEGFPYRVVSDWARKQSLGPKDKRKLLIAEADMFIEHMRTYRKHLP